MLTILAVIIGVFILAAALGVLGAEDPGNGWEHHQQDEPPAEPEPDLTAETSAPPVAA